MISSYKLKVLMRMIKGYFSKLLETKSAAGCNGNAQRKSSMISIVTLAIGFGITIVRVAERQGVLIK